MSWACAQRAAATICSDRPRSAGRILSHGAGEQLHVRGEITRRNGPPARATIVRVRPIQPDLAAARDCQLPAIRRARVRFRSRSAHDDAERLARFGAKLTPATTAGRSHGRRSTAFCPPTCAAARQGVAGSGGQQGIQPTGRRRGPSTSLPAAGGFRWRQCEPAAAAPASMIRKWWSV